MGIRRGATRATGNRGVSITHKILDGVHRDSVINAQLVQFVLNNGVLVPGGDGDHTPGLLIPVILFCSDVPASVGARSEYADVTQASGDVLVAPVWYETAQIECDSTATPHTGIFTPDLAGRYPELQIATGSTVTNGVDIAGWMVSVNLVDRLHLGGQAEALNPSLFLEAITESPCISGRAQTQDINAAGGFAVPIIMHEDNYTQAIQDADNSFTSGDNEFRVVGIYGDPGGSI